MDIKVERFKKESSGSSCYDCDQCHKPSKEITHLLIGGHRGILLFLCDNCLDNLITKVRDSRNGRP